MFFIFNLPQPYFFSLFSHLSQRLSVSTRVVRLSRARLTHARSVPPSPRPRPPLPCPAPNAQGRRLRRAALHLFADMRNLLGMPNTLNVLTPTRFYSPGSRASSSASAAAGASASGAPLSTYPTFV
jgi:hypothetical protein